jgi:hypothetical protein|tara:strand:- start:3077 stop:3328 length:252 start_codon:yes stop_codon:yes gene_type:complete
MFLEYKRLTDEELDEKMNEVMQKVNMAHSMGLEAAVDQLQALLEQLQLELTERLDMQRYDMINERMPESLVVGEDEDEPDDDE